MPEIFRFEGYSVVIYPNDHRPAHVHVVGAEGYAVFILLPPRAGVELREAEGLRSKQLKVIRDVLVENIAALVEAWERIHGPL